jgi:chromosome segregation ATPase
MRIELAECQSQLVAERYAHEKTTEQLQVSETERHRLAGLLQAAEVHQAGLGTRLEAREQALQDLQQQSQQTNIAHQRELDALQEAHTAQIKDVGQRAQDDLHKQLLEVDRVRTAYATLERKLETQREKAEATETRLQQEILALTATRGTLESHLQGAETRSKTLEEQLMATHAVLAEANARVQHADTERDAARVRLQVLEEWKASLTPPTPIERPQAAVKEHKQPGSPRRKGNT